MVAPKKKNISLHTFFIYLFFLRDPVWLFSLMRKITNSAPQWPTGVRLHHLLVGSYSNLPNVFFLVLYQ